MALCAASLLVSSATLGKEEKKAHQGGKGTDFAAKERGTDRLEELRKRVREYEAALSRGVPPPEEKETEMDRLIRSNVKRPERKLSDREEVLHSLLEDPMKKQNLGALKLYLYSSSNAQEKAELGTAYCLGCLATEQWNEGTRTSILMRRAYPKDPNVALLTLKSFFNDCRKCAGEGQLSTKCDKCKGKKSCPFYDCKGGKLSNPDLMIGGKAPNCPQCGGSDKCRSCEGTGQMKIRCSECSGRGSNLSLRSIESGYIKYLRGIKP